VASGLLPLGCYTILFAGDGGEAEVEVQVVAFDPNDAAGLGLTGGNEAVGRPTTQAGMIRRLFERSSNKTTRDRATGLKKVYGVNDTTVLETQEQTTTGSIDQESRGT
jgi:hypothetical protein